MTEKQIEAAARKLCEIRGEDPDAFSNTAIGYSGYTARSIAHYLLWEVAKSDIRKELKQRQIRQAIDSALEGS